MTQHFHWRFLRPAWRPRAGPLPLRPAEAISSLELCGILLSANLAVLARDNFNQLSSALAPRTIRTLLESRWKVKSAIDCRRAIELNLKNLGKTYPEEADAFAAWNGRSPIGSETYTLLHEICDRLCEVGVVGSARQINGAHLSMMAWDIQQVAYLTRLGFALGYLSRGMAEGTLARLHSAARAGYGSWKDFSLSALIATGLRGHTEPSDLRGWKRLARSQATLLLVVDRAARRFGPDPQPPARPKPGRSAGRSG